MSTWRILRATGHARESQTASLVISGTRHDEACALIRRRSSDAFPGRRAVGVVAFEGVENAGESAALARGAAARGGGRRPGGWAPVPSPSTRASPAGARRTGDSARSRRTTRPRSRTSCAAFGRVSRCGTSTARRPLQHGLAAAPRAGRRRGPRPPSRETSSSVRGRRPSRAVRLLGEPEARPPKAGEVIYADRRRRALPPLELEGGRPHEADGGDDEGIARRRGTPAGGPWASSTAALRQELAGARRGALRGARRSVDRGSGDVRRRNSRSPKR